MTSCTVAIPCFNSRTTIGKTLEALRKQTVAPDEVLVIDSSNDGTDTYIATEFPEVRLHHLEQQTYPGRGRNLAIELSGTDLILFTDADAVPAEDWVETHLRLQDAHPETAVLGGSILNQNPETRPSRFSFACEFTGYAPNLDAGEREIVPSVNWAVRRDVVRPTGITLPEWGLPGGEDSGYCLALRKAGLAVRFSPEPRVYHINRSTWAAFFRHMRGSGRAAGLVEYVQPGNPPWLPRIGGLVLLAAPVRVALIWRRLWREDPKLFWETLLFAPCLLAAMVWHMGGYWQGVREARKNERAAS